jgi:hypothetical protein
MRALDGSLVSFSNCDDKFMTDETLNLKKIVNSSGFLFQLRVEREVGPSRLHQWEVLAREHPWIDKESENEGYIDLVLGQGITRMVIECKRTQDANWIFLLPDNSYGTQLRSMYISSVAPQQYRSGAHDFHPNPQSFISEFCVVRGQGEKDSPMLERISGGLLNSLEALAVEEVLLSSRYSYGNRYVYVPVIVTNARLHVCRFKIEDVSLDEGKLTDANFESVPLIRFRKSLTTRLTQNSAADTIEQANKNKLRTVLVVHADSFDDLLFNWKLQLNELNQPPW